MPRVRIKICGITRGQDALLAENLRADFLGFIFYRAFPRYVMPETAATIIASLSTAKPVGVFVDTLGWKC